MGSKCCPCCQHDEKTSKIDSCLDQEKNKALQVIKLLFLGAGGSGKSTLFRQLRLLHGNGLQLEERANYRSSIYLNIVEGMKNLLEGNVLFNSGEESDSEDVGLSDVAMCEEKLADFIKRVDDGALITQECADYFKRAWNDKGMQETWRYRSKLQLQDSLKYFIENIDRIAMEDYIPSKDDVMHVRIKTTGIVEEDLTMENRHFKIVDVGGQRSERRKWINCFGDVTGLIFVASLTAYNQYLYEDENVNRLHESLKIWGELLNDSDTFDDACIVLFLNKADLFKEMCMETPIKKCMQHYTGGLSEDDQYEYIKNLYLSKVKAKSRLSGRGSLAKTRDVFTHKTCATNTDQIKVIFHAVTQYVIKKALINAGLLPPTSF